MGCAKHGARRKRAPPEWLHEEDTVNDHNSMDVKERGHRRNTVGTQKGERVKSVMSRARDILRAGFYALSRVHETASSLSIAHILARFRRPPQQNELQDIEAGVLHDIDERTSNLEKLADKLSRRIGGRGCKPDVNLGALSSMVSSYDRHEQMPSAAFEY
jgi:hypothetical protein